MRQVIAPRPVNAPIQQFLPPHTQTLPYHAGYDPRAVVQPSQPPYIPTMAYPVHQNIAPQLLYSQGIQNVPFQGYLPQYQPLYVQGPPLAYQAPYYPQYGVPAISLAPVSERHRQMDYNHNFDYEAANFLTDTKIVENSVFCVICGHNYKASERDEHLKKHMRRSQHSEPIHLDFPVKLPQDSKVGSKKQYITKPLVQPQQHTILYEPLVYELVQEVLYEDQARAAVKDEAIGQDPSFPLDPSNPFDYKVGRGSSNSFGAGNSLNEHVPFLDYNPIMQSSNKSVNNKANESRVSANQSGLLA